MLCISRREFEILNLHTSDGLIEIEVTKIRGGKVTIGVQAPRTITIVRAEIDQIPEIKKDGVSLFKRIQLLWEWTAYNWRLKSGGL